MSERRVIWAEGSRRTVELLSGGSITLTINANWLMLHKRDRRWLVELADLVTRYAMLAEQERAVLGVWAER